MPAVAEPLPAWILPGSALVEERDFGGTGPGGGRRRGVFLTTPPTPYELRGKATSAENFENLLAYLGLPVFARALNGGEINIKRSLLLLPNRG